MRLQSRPVIRYDLDGEDHWEPWGESGACMEVSYEMVCSCFNNEECGTISTMNHANYRTFVNPYRVKSIRFPNI